MKTLKHKKLNCSPENEQNKKGYSCYSDETLIKLRDLWNARHPDAIISSNESQEIWNILNNHLKKSCNKESCWLKQQFVAGKLNKNIILNESFAPVTPIEWKNNPNEWLSSVYIINVMNQYEYAYKCFEFIGPSPIDYDTKQLYGETVWPELSNFYLKHQMKKGKNKIGIIFNTDPHYKGGSHWVSLFINIKKKFIFYYDSVGSPIPPNIMKFVNKVREQGKQNKIDFFFDENKNIEHQKKDGQCAMYSLYFIIQMLKDKVTPQYLKTHRITDEQMIQFRKIYFNEEL
jgi:hypothetical protein